MSDRGKPVLSRRVTRIVDAWVDPFDGVVEHLR